MHFCVLVVTKDKPTDDVLAKALAPFGRHALGNDAKWDWYALGGRYSGHLIPLHFADTVTGRAHFPEHEISDDGIIDTSAAKIAKYGSTAPGVDALQRRNARTNDIFMPVFAVLIDACWHEPNDIAMRASFRDAVNRLFGGDGDPSESMTRTWRGPYRTSCPHF
jgi:hypothetical protein